MLPLNEGLHAVWPELEKYCHLGTWGVLLYFKLVWQFLILLAFVVANGLILNNPFGNLDTLTLWLGQLLASLFTTGWIFNTTLRLNICMLRYSSHANVRNVIEVIKKLQLNRFVFQHNFLILLFGAEPPSLNNSFPILALQSQQQQSRPNIWVPLVEFK